MKHTSKNGMVFINGYSKGLSKKDKKVIEAFYNQDAAEGKLVNTDGRMLMKMGLGGQPLAHWSRGLIVITAISDVKSTDQILRYMKKYIPKGNFSPKTPISNWI